MPYNHKLTSKSINFIANTGSRNRLRIPVAGVRNSQIQPGDRVRVMFNHNKLEVSIVKDVKGNYRVEKDGAIRFPAHKFALSAINNIINADSIHNKIICI